MINHVRTLLLNEPAAALDGPYEEYVPEESRTLALPPVLARVYGILFPTSDRAAKNYRLAQLMALYHSCPDLEYFVLDKDKRISYEPRGEALQLRRLATLGDLQDLVFAMNLSPDEIDELFGSPRLSPYDTFHYFWKEMCFFPYKVAGITLALAYRMDELREKS